MQHCQFILNFYDYCIQYDTRTYLIASTIIFTTSSSGMALPFLSSFSTTPPCMARIESWDRGTCKQLTWMRGKKLTWESLIPITRYRFCITMNESINVHYSVFKIKHITPVLVSLHYFPVCFRIDFKILLITFKFLHGLAPCYIFDLLIPYVPAHTWRSSGRGLLAVLERGEHHGPTYSHSCGKICPRSCRLSRSRLLNPPLKYTFNGEPFVILSFYWYVLMSIQWCSFYFVV